MGQFSFSLGLQAIRPAETERRAFVQASVQIWEGDTRLSNIVLLDLVELLDAPADPTLTPLEYALKCMLPIVAALEARGAIDDAQGNTASLQELAQAAKQVPSKM